MAKPILGQGGSGEVVVYQLNNQDEFVLDTITFTLETGLTTGHRTPEVLIFADGQHLIGRIPDWNDIFESMTATYTFGRGLTPFCGTINSGGAVQNDLPFTVLEPKCEIHVRTVDDTGAVFLDDTFTDVVLWVEDLSASASGGGGGGGLNDPAAWWLYAAAGSR